MVPGERRPVTTSSFPLNKWSPILGHILLSIKDLDCSNRTEMNKQIYKILLSLQMKKLFSFRYFCIELYSRSTVYVQTSTEQVVNNFMQTHSHGLQNLVNMNLYGCPTLDPDATFSLFQIRPTKDGKRPFPIFKRNAVLNNLSTWTCTASTHAIPYHYTSTF